MGSGGRGDWSGRVSDEGTLKGVGEGGGRVGSGSSAKGNRNTHSGESGSTRILLEAPITHFQPDSMVSITIPENTPIQRRTVDGRWEGHPISSGGGVSGDVLAGSKIKLWSLFIQLYHNKRQQILSEQELPVVDWAEQAVAVQQERVGKVI